MGQWMKVCDVSDVPPGAKFSVDVGDQRIMIVNLDGRFLAVDRICTHEEAELSMGFIMDNRVTCPLHLSEFNLETGEVLSPPATRPLKTFNVKIEDLSILVEV